MTVVNARFKFFYLFVCMFIQNVSVHTIQTQKTTPLKTEQTVFQRLETRGQQAHGVLKTASHQKNAN